MTNLKWSLFLILSVGFLAAGTSFAAGDDYGYPDIDGFAATVVGTPSDLEADLKIRPKLKLYGLKVFPDRPIRKYTWYHNKLRYLLLYQNHPAPLVFVVAGTGASYHGPTIEKIFLALYKAGFHVASIPSPTSFQFMIAASSTQVPGVLDDDSRDLYRVLRMAWDTQIKKKIQVTDFHVTGYSLGAAQAAYLSYIDETEKAFNFKKVLMINPPVNLYNSARLLDGYLRDNIKTGREIVEYWNRLTGVLGEEYASLDKEVHLSSDFLYEAYKNRGATDTNLKILIGLAFAITAQNMITTADAVTQSGYVIPVGTTAKLTANVDEYFLVAGRTSFEQYFKELLLPFYKKNDPSVTEESLIQRASLQSIEDYLRRSSKIGLMTNADDIILAPGELEWLEDVFGDRAKIYPRGGHLGNVGYRDNIAYLTRYFGGREVR